MAKSQFTGKNAPGTNPAGHVTTTKNIRKDAPSSNVPEEERVSLSDGIETKDQLRARLKELDAKENRTPEEEAELTNLSRMGANVPR